MKKIFFAIVVVCTAYGSAWGICMGPARPGGTSCQAGMYNAPSPADGEGSYCCSICPTNTYQEESGTYFSCTPCPAGTGTIGDTAADHDSIDDCIPMETEEISCNPGYYLPADSTSCTQCPKNSYCPGGTFTETTSDSGITQCPDNMYSPLGSDSADDCGRVLHIGEYILYLRTAKLTVPSLNVQIGNTIYYGDMFPA